MWDPLSHEATKEDMEEPVDEVSLRGRECSHARSRSSPASERGDTAGQDQELPHSIYDLSSVRIENDWLWFSEKGNIILPRK